jgi:hypothetical protein
MGNRERARSMGCALRGRRPRRGFVPVAVLALSAMFAVSAAPALAGTPETPETGVAEPAATSAVLHGVLNPNAKGEPGSYQFSYLPSATECVPGALAPSFPSFAFGIEKEAAETTVTGLQPSREYAFCLIAYSVLGAAEPSAPSPAVAFKTLPAVPAVDGESVSGVSSTAATLEAQVNANNQSTTYSFEYSTEQSGGVLGGAIVTVPAVPGGPLEGFGDQTASAPAEGLLPGTTYFYRVLATNATGTTDGAVSETGFTTVPTPKTEPVTAITATTATLNGTLTPLNATVPAEYVFDYNQGAACVGGSESAPVSAGTGAGPKTVESAVTALQPGAEYSVCLLSKNAFGSELDPAVAQVSFRTPAAAPAITGESSSAVSTESATLESQVNPDGQETTCSFEYSSEQPKVEAGEGTVVACAHPLGAGTTPVGGSAKLTGLELHKEYFYRALAKNASGAVSDATVEHFETENTVPPSLTGEEAPLSDITETTATLTAQVNPNGAQVTACLVEYGTDTSYGHSAACVKPDAAEVGAGREPVTVTVPVSELKPNVTYHWRLIASSAAGTSTSVDHTFVDETTPVSPPGTCPQEQARLESRSSRLPECRNYELVTPPEKNGSHIEALFAGTGSWGPLIASNGTDVMAPSIQCFAQTESCTGLREVGEGEPYEFARTSQGWATHPLAPPATTYGISSQLNEDANQHTTLFSAPGSPSKTREHFYVRTGQGTPQDIGPVGEHPESFSGEDLAQLPAAADTAATADFSHMLFATHASHGSVPLWALNGLPEEESSVYEYAGQDTGLPLSVGVAGGFESTSLVSGCGTALGDQLYNPSVEYGSLSADGRVVYFSALGHNHAACGAGVLAPLTNQLFARVDGESPGLAHTVSISTPTPSSCHSECQAVQGNPQDADFEGASQDGSRAFFTSTQQLTDTASQGQGEAGEECQFSTGSGCNLYESVCVAPCGTHAEEPLAKGRELIDISAGAKAHGGPRVRGVMAISGDGSHVYFVARGKLAGNPGVLGATAEEGQANLYVYAQGQPLRFIVTLPPRDEQEFEQQQFKEWTHGIKVANVTPDGRFLVFLSHHALTADDTRPEGPAQIYRYDAQTAGIVRVSIGQNGFNDNGNAGTAEPDIVHAYKGWQTAASPANGNPTMSNDGQYVFFESPVALAPGALNEVPVNKVPPLREFLAQNIYEFHDGQVYLISDGKDTSPNPGDPSTKSSTRLVGSDESGRNVFFWTTSQVTPQDTDTQRDIYDARICETGDPCVTPPAAAQACQEATCQGPSPAPPGFATPGSATYSGPGNLSLPQSGPPAKPKPLTRAQKLAKALKACRAKHNKQRRHVCERAAHKKYATKAAKTSKGSK